MFNKRFGFFYERRYRKGGTWISEIQEDSLSMAGSNWAPSLVNRILATAFIGLKRCCHLMGLCVRWYRFTINYSNSIRFWWITCASIQNILDAAESEAFFGHILWNAAIGVIMIDGSLRGIIPNINAVLGHRTFSIIIIFIIFIINDVFMVITGYYRCK